jgi:hypothetical protein
MIKLLGERDDMTCTFGLMKRHRFTDTNFSRAHRYVSCMGRIRELHCNYWGVNPYSLSPSTKGEAI